MAVAAGTVLTVQFGPQFIARQVVRTYLDGLNIDTSGVNTLRVRLLRGELTFGPVTFRGADAMAGQVGRMGVRLDVPHLFQRKALVRSIVIEGVRFEIRQAEDGSFSLNGVPLGSLLSDYLKRKQFKEPGSDSEPPAPPTESQPPIPEGGRKWQYAGLEELVIRDSRVACIDARGGEADMHVNELDLIGFHSWTPENPGKYSLDAEINEIGMTASGIARPFLDKFEVDGKAAVTGIKVSRIERYLGSLGFTSQSGQVDLSVSDFGVAVFAAGRVDARLAAAGTLTGLDLAHPLFGKGQLATGLLRLDNVSVSYEASREMTVAGDFDADLQASSFRLSDGTEAVFSHARFGLPATIVKTAPGKLPELTVAPQLDVTDLRFGGRDVRGSVGNVAVRLRGFSIEGTEAGAPFLASGSVAVDRINLRLPEAEPIVVVADQARVDLAETHIVLPPGGGARVAGGVAFVSRQVSIATEESAPSQRSAPARPRFEAGRLALELPTVVFDNTRTLTTDLSATGSRLSLEDLLFRGQAIEGRIGDATIELSNITKTGDTSPLITGGTVAAKGLDLRLPGVEPISIAMRQLRAAFDEARIASGLEPVRLAASISLETNDLRMLLQELGRHGLPPPPPTRIEAARLTALVPAVSTVAPGTGNTPDVTMHAARPRVVVERLQFGGADIQGTIDAAELRLTGIDLETASPGSPFIASGKIITRDMDLLVPDAEPVAIIAQTADVDMTRTRFAFPSSRVLIEGAVGIDSRQLAILLHERKPENGSAPPPPMEIATQRFAGDVHLLRVEERRRIGTHVNVVTPKLTFDRFRMVKSKNEQETVQLTSSFLTLHRASVDVNVGGGVTVGGEGHVVGPDASLAVGAKTSGGMTASNPTVEGKINGLDADLQHFSYRGEPAGTGFGMAGRFGVAGLEGRQSSDRTGESVNRLALSRLMLDVADFDIVKREDDPEWRAQLDLDLGSMTADVNGSVAGHVGVNGISLNHLHASSPRSYAFDRLALGSFDAALTRFAAPGSPETLGTPAPEETVSETWPPTDLPAIKANRANLFCSGQIRFVDQTMSPPVDTTLTVDALNLENLDTTDPDVRTGLSLRARLDDGSIRMQGWAEAFRHEPSFRIRTDIQDLNLQTLWPYIGPSVGVDVVRGTLTLGTDAVANHGQLDALVRTRLVGLRMRDRSSANGDKTSRTLGEPLSDLISLLENRDGAVAFLLPVRGDLLSPDVRYGRAIRGLLPSILRAMITSPVRFASSTLSVMQKIRSDEAAPAPETSANAEDARGAPSR